MIPVLTLLLAIFVLTRKLVAMYREEVGAYPKVELWSGVLVCMAAVAVAAVLLTTLAACDAGAASAEYPLAGC